MDILDRKDLHEKPYNVPEGYFRNLEQRLSAIPGSYRRFRPVYAFAMAACLTSVLASGAFLMHRYSEDTILQPTYEQIASVDLIPYTFDESQLYISDSSDSDLIEFLTENQIIF